MFPTPLGAAVETVEIPAVSAVPSTPGQVELALLLPELQWLVNQGEMLGNPGRDAAHIAGQLLRSRFSERCRVVGEVPMPRPAWPVANAATPDEAPAVDPGPTAERSEWAATLERDESNFQDYLRTARSEWQRLGIPSERQPMLNRFLLEAVRDIEVLCEVGQHVEGGEVRTFPESVTGGTGPVTDEESLLAAYYYREVTRRMLQRMGVGVDDQFLRLLVSRGLGRPITPLSVIVP